MLSKSARKRILPCKSAGKRAVAAGVGVAVKAFSAKAIGVSVGAGLLFELLRTATWVGVGVLVGVAVTIQGVPVVNAIAVS